MNGQVEFSATRWKPYAPPWLMVRRSRICTLGADGALAVDRDQVVHQGEGVEVAEVVDTKTAAARRFLCGFLDATLDGAGVSDALHSTEPRRCPAAT